MGVDLREAEVGDRRDLKTPQDLFAADAPRAELFKKPDCFRRCHNLKMQEQRANPSAFSGVMMMFEQSALVFGKVPDDPNVDHQDNGHEDGVSMSSHLARSRAVYEFVDLDRNEKG